MFSSIKTVLYYLLRHDIMELVGKTRFNQPNDTPLQSFQ
jgi:hypothetical protein